LQILCFNWRAYVSAAALGLACCALGLRPDLPSGFRMVLGVGGGLILLWLTASLAVSHYVYDLSGLREWMWLRDWFPSTPQRWVRLHAGWDEMGLALQRVFPVRRPRSLDFYDGKEMSEPSIRVARKTGAAADPSEAADWRALPLEDGGCDAVFLIMAAHELRRPLARELLFRELHRVLEPGGRVFLLEHLRNAANFLAFGPGFMHFLPRREWLRLARVAGFEVQATGSVTPFVGAFLLRKSAGLVWTGVEGLRHIEERAEDDVVMARTNGGNNE
jgi:hypothetical protein